MSLLLGVSSGPAPPTNNGQMFSAAARLMALSVVLASCAAPDFETRRNHDLVLRPYRNQGIYGASIVSAPASPILLSADVRPPDTTQALHVFRQITSAAPQSTPWTLWQPSTRLADAELEIRRADHTLLHRYRTGFQTVGQPWIALTRAPTPRLEPEALTIPPTNYAPLFGITVAPAAPASTSWPLWWASSIPTFADVEIRRADHNALHRFRTVYQTVGQPVWALHWRSSVPDTADRAWPSYDQNQGLHRYRVGYQTVGQPWQLFYGQPKAQRPEAEPVVLRYIDNASLYNRGAGVAPPTGNFRVIGSAIVRRGLRSST